MRIASQPVVRLFSSVSFVIFVSSVCAPVAQAQPADAVGIRAQGMGGAFTAVADDATASWWNPAGLAGGAYFNALIEYSTRREPPNDRTAGGDLQNASQTDARDFAVAFPALGLSYYRLQVSQIQPQTSTGTTAASRQEGGATEVHLRSMEVSQFGATVGQSLGSHFVIGSTLKLVSGGAALLVRPDGTGSIAAAADISIPTATHAGLDVGAMAVYGRARFGLMVRNVNEVEFGSGPDAFTLNRQVRVGAAVSSGTRGVIGSATLAMDADLTRTPTIFGDERRLAFGAETFMSNTKFGFRGGVSVNTIDSRRTALSAGASAAFKAGMYLDAEYTGGTDQGHHGWGAALRLTF